MQQQIVDGKNVRETIPVPHQLRRRLWYGVISSIIFILIVTIEGYQRTDYDAMHQSISALSLSSRGWIQVLNFIIFGAFVISTAIIWHKILIGQRRARAFPVLIAIAGASIIICGIIPQDPAPGYDPQGLALKEPTLTGLLHLLFAGIGALSSVVSLLIMARHFSKEPLWYGWTVYSVIMAIVMIACVTVYGIYSTRSTGYAGSFERVAVMVLPVWSLTFLVRLETGVPFMKK